MAQNVSDLTYVSFPISKYEKTEDGDLIVVGKATDGSVDSDEQIVDPVWSAKALTDWMDTGGNLRVQHQAMRDPAGKGLAVEINKDGDGAHWVRSLVVEPVAKRLVEKGVLTAYSVGIARPVIQRDPTGKARGGIVAGGHLAEISLVDRPANKNCGLMIAKAAKGAEGGIELVGEVFGDPEFLAKAATEDDLLTKGRDGDDAGVPVSSASGGAAGNDDNSAPGSQEDAAGDDSNPGGEDDDDDASGGVSKAALGLIAGASHEDRAAYKAARREWLGREPSVKGVAGGTEYLAKRADWMRWNSEGEAEGLTGTREGAEVWLAKRDFSASERQSAASSGAAMSDGSFPIKSGEDLGNAIHLAGHAKDPAAARAHIKRRAAALGMSDRIPDSWKQETADLAAADPADLIKLYDDGIVTAEEARTILGHGIYDAAVKTVSAAGKASDGDGDGKQCGTCEGSGKIRGGGMKCPDCKGSGKMTAKADEPQAAAAEEADAAKTGDEAESKAARRAAKAARREAALAALAETVTKSVEAGTISQEAGDEIIAQAAAKAMRGKRTLPADTAPVKPHREPDGTSTVEQFEPDAGLATDHDPTADNVPSSLGPAGSMGGKSEAPYAVARMHDVACAAYGNDAIRAEYPALKSIADAIGLDWLNGEAARYASEGKAKKAARWLAVSEQASALKSLDPLAVEDGRAHLHKAFADMYPDLHISPKDGIRPGSYQRPYLAAGHAAENAMHNGSPNIPPSSHTPAPEDFHRGLITEGHQADSPANKAGTDPSNFAGVQPVTGAARTYYSHAQREAARTALASLHDHIAASFPDLCPMAASKSVMPPHNGAENTPKPVTPASQGGIATVGKEETVHVHAGVSEADIASAIQKSLLRYAARNGQGGGGLREQAPVLTRKKLEKAAAQMGLELVERRMPPEALPGQVQPGLSAAELKALLAEQIGPLAENYQNQMDSLRKQVDEIGARPDPSMAPVRGALARVPDGTAVPVERRSLVDEAAVTANKMAAAQEAHYRAYVAALSHSPDPGVREAALATLDKLSAAAPAGVSG